MMKMRQGVTFFQNVLFYHECSEMFYQKVLLLSQVKLKMLMNKKYST